MKTVMADINDVVLSDMEYEADIIDATTLNSKYEAGIQGYQGRELNMNKKHKTRDVKDDISDAVVPKHRTQVGHQGLLRQRVQEARDGGWDARANHKDRSDENRSVTTVMNNANAPIEDLR
jgi:hypothetical protein